MPTLAFRSQSPPPAPEQSREALATLGQTTSDVKLDRFGWSYVAHDRVSFVPWTLADVLFDLFETLPQDQSMLDRVPGGARKSARPTWEERWAREAKPVLLGPA